MNDEQRKDAEWAEKVKDADHKRALEVRAANSADTAAAQVAKAAGGARWLILATFVAVAICLVVVAIKGLSLLSLSLIGLVIAILFAMIGFALFLIGAQGTFKLTGQQGSRVPGLESSAPGLIAMVCATVVVYLSFQGAGPLNPSTESAADGGTPTAGAPAAADSGATPDAGP